MGTTIIKEKFYSGEYFFLLAGYHKVGNAVLPTKYFLGIRKVEDGKSVVEDYMHRPLNIDPQQIDDDAIVGMMLDNIFNQDNTDQEYIQENFTVCWSGQEQEFTDLESAQQFSTYLQGQGYSSDIWQGDDLLQTTFPEKFTHVMYTREFSGAK